jgi:hypothetical protein
MSTAPNLSGMLGHLLGEPTRGVVGLVDDLLRLCQEHSLQVECQAGRCRVRPPGGGWEEWVEVPLRKSVVRAMLARLAALCNERTPNSVSPYGGKGRLSAGANPPAVFTVAFTNTLAEQQFELSPEPGREARQAPLVDAPCGILPDQDPTAGRPRE